MATGAGQPLASLIRQKKDILANISDFSCMPRISLHTFTFISVLLFLVGCKGEDTKKEKPDPNMLFDDPHSFARPKLVTADHLDLVVIVDFEKRVIRGNANWTIHNHGGADSLILDTDGLNVDEVRVDGKVVQFTVGPEKEFLGRPLSVPILPETDQVSIHYETSASAKALMWLTPQQTAGKKYPFLFTQSQAILARSWIPCPDGPGMRFTYTAKIKVPEELMALMSAGNPVEKSAHGEYSFEMNQRIPAYLMALAVGDLQFAEVGSRTGVYAEPVMLKKAEYEFGEMEEMLLTAEKLYGPYRWERYDLIVLPPSFPFGGMENPRLTFATPTILAGDRSLTSLVAHGLAHSWSGNLVTNATWNDFWLNEGFTVYFERRIMEEMKGRSYSEMLAQLGFQELQGTVQRLSTVDNQPEDTHLKLNLQDRDPDAGMTDVAYEKGYFFLRLIEETVGREKFDAFLKKYFEENAFKVMTTEVFVEKLKTELLGSDSVLIDSIGIDKWIYNPGIPANVPLVSNERFAAVDSTLAKWRSGAAPKDLTTKDWSSHEWLYFLRNLGTGLGAGQISGLDAAFGFTKSGNCEILGEWFRICIIHGYKTVYPDIQKFLMEVGRRKFLKPLYGALVVTPEGKNWAKEVYKKARPNYHSVATETIDKMLDWK